MKEWMKFYDVSPSGEVKSLDREYVNSRGQKRTVKSHVLKPVKIDTAMKKSLSVVTVMI